METIMTDRKPAKRPARKAAPNAKMPDLKPAIATGDKASKTKGGALPRRGTGWDDLEQRV